MDIASLLIFIGATAGWLSGTFMKNGGIGLLGNILIGIAGGVAGGYLFRLPGLSSDGGLIGTMLVAAAAAATLLAVIVHFKNGKKTSIHYRGDELWVRRKPLNRR